MLELNIGKLPSSGVYELTGHASEYYDREKKLAGIPALDHRNEAVSTAVILLAKHMNAWCGPDSVRVSEPPVPRNLRSHEPKHSKHSMEVLCILQGRDFVFQESEKQDADLSRYCTRENRLYSEL